MRLPAVTDLDGVDAAAIGIPFDTATSFRAGARFGPEAIRSASALLRPFHPALGIDLVETLSVVDYGDLPIAPGDTAETYRRVEEALGAVVASGWAATSSRSRRRTTDRDSRPRSRRRPSSGSSWRSAQLPGRRSSAGEEEFDRAEGW
jgi:Arginase family